MREEDKHTTITGTKPIAVTHVNTTTQVPPVVYMYTPSLDGICVYREYNSPGSVGGCGCGAVEEDGEL